MKKIFILDNYDSFTYNLMDLIKQNFNGIVDVARDIELDNLEYYDGIIISPGPGSPKTTPKAMEIIDKYHSSKPILGICLGMQCINEYFGGDTIKSNYPIHGKQSLLLSVNSTKLFNNIDFPAKVARYHSLKIVPSKNIIVTGISDDEMIMSIEHKKYKIYGLQFHPESFLTDFGYKFICNFLELAGLNG